MIFIILLIALVLRFISLNQSLWLDEAISVNIAGALDFKSIVLNFSSNLESIVSSMVFLAIKI